MNPHPRDFTVQVILPQSVPLRFHVPMQPQEIQVWTPARLIGALARAILSRPRQTRQARPALVRADRRA